MNFDEGSVLFETKKQHLNEVVLYLQQAMNPVGTKANTLVKHMKDGKIETESRVSFWLTTFPPQGVREVVLTKGVFQRVLLLIRPWSIERREQVSEERMNTAFKRPPEYDVTMDDFTEYFSTIRKMLRARTCALAGISDFDWNGMIDDDREKTAQEIMYDFWRVDASYHPLLNSHKDHMYELVRMMDPKMADVVCAFIPNLLNYTSIFAVHIGLLEAYHKHSGDLDAMAKDPETFTFNGDHVEMAAEIIYDLYEELVTWLESEVELESVTRDRKARKDAWKKAWSASKLTSIEGHQGDWVRKSELMTIYAKQNGGVSRNTQFLHFKDARSMFAEASIGVTKYVQLVPE